MTDSLALVHRFAKALDDEDYRLAQMLIDDECEYTCRGEQYHGPAEIIASYRNNGNLAKSFDAIEYESKVVMEVPGRFRIQFTDHLTHSDHRFTFKCEQVIELNEAGRIVRIEHVDLPGQTEALAEFKKLLTDDNASSE